MITAAPGAGKTTRVPPALLPDGPVILLQPRRVAARAIAARIAEERGWTLGREIGWQVRFERRFGAETRLLVVTEGILTARLQTDPLLSDFATIILDEFHERSIHADLAIALARQAWRARDDLRIVVMSATLESQPVSAFLDGCPVIDVPGRTHPLDISYQPGRSVADAAVDLLGATDGQILCFLPGAPEIRRVVSELQHKAGSAVDVVPLHGSLNADEQDLALRPSPRRRVIVATNIAETSLTVPGVTAVIDAGLQKVARYDAERGIDSLETERITLDAADQRAGRAGRLAPGVVQRLWDARDRLRPHREPEIHRVDLSGTVLDVIAWGGDPRTLEWFERPREEALEAALTLLARLGLIAPEQAGPPDPAVGGCRPRRNSRPSVSRCAGSRCIHGWRGCSWNPAERVRSRRPARCCRSVTCFRRARRRLRRTCCLPSTTGARCRRTFSEWRIRSRTSYFGTSNLSESDFQRAILSGYPDRVAQRREPGSPNVLLASGTGATIAAESGVRDGEFLVALARSGRPKCRPGADTRVRPCTRRETPRRGESGRRCPHPHREPHRT